MVCCGVVGRCLTPRNGGSDYRYMPCLFYCIWTPLSEMHILLAQQEFVKGILRAKGFILKSQLLTEASTVQPQPPPIKHFDLRLK